MEPETLTELMDSEAMQDVADIVEDAERLARRLELLDRLRNNQEILSHSAFNEFMKSPRHFIAYKLRQKKTTPAMAFGSMCHCLVLEPSEFENRYIVSPKFDRRTKVGKEAFAEFASTAGDKLIVSESDYQNANYLRDCLYKNESSAFVLERIKQTEVPIEWKYKGLQWHGYIDGQGNGIKCDLKFMQDASPKKIERAIRFDGYGNQAVHYQRGSNKPDDDYYLIACDRSGNITVCELTKGFLHICSQEIDTYIAHFKRCQYLDMWHRSFDFFAPNGIYQITSW